VEVGSDVGGYSCRGDCGHGGDDSYGGDDGYSGHDGYSADGGHGDGRPGVRAVLDGTDLEDEFADTTSSIATSVATLRRWGGRRAMARLAELPPTRYAVVEVVDVVVGADGPLAVRDVADRLGLAPSRASLLVAQANAAGWVCLTEDPYDLRITAVLATDEGRRVVASVHGALAVEVDRATFLWPDADRAALARLLARFVARVEQPLGTWVF
jgi:DNA-binding MarR family transcriptional regulator